MWCGYLFKVHASSTTHASHVTHARHTAHTTHAGHASHSAHAGHSTHAAHSSHVHVIRNIGGGLILLILVDPFAEVCLEEGVLHLLFGEARPVLGFFLLLADDQVEGARV